MTKKWQIDYAELGPLYYAIYNPFCGPSASGRHADHQPLEVYKLEGDQYRLLSGNPIWLPEIGLGIGTELGKYRGRSREWVYWYDQEGRRYLTPDESAEQERQQRQRAQQWNKNGNGPSRLSRRWNKNGNGPSRLSNGPNG